NSEIIDAYCRILILAKQLGRVNTFSEQKTRELLELKKTLGYDDPRLRLENCDLCGNSVFDRGYSEFVPAAAAFAKEKDCACSGEACTCKTAASEGKNVANLDSLVRLISDQVMAALA